MGYKTEVHFRRKTDAVLIGWKSSDFELVDRLEVNHEDLIPRYG